MSLISGLAKLIVSAAKSKTAQKTAKNTTKKLLTYTKPQVKTITTIFKGTGTTVTKFNVPSFKFINENGVPYHLVKSTKFGKNSKCRSLDIKGIKCYKNAKNEKIYTIDGYYGTLNGNELKNYIEERTVFQKRYENANFLEKIVLKVLEETPEGHGYLRLVS